jgi:hypothetical protein
VYANEVNQRTVVFWTIRGASYVVREWGQGYVPSKRPGLSPRLPAVLWGLLADIFETYVHPAPALPWEDNITARTGIKGGAILGAHSEEIDIGV